jgi:ribosomal protein S18 acetylase RimI-like enzyme
MPSTRGSSATALIVSGARIDDMDRVRSASVTELHEVHGGPFVRHQLTSRSVRAIWRRRDAMVVDQHRDRHGRHVADPVLFCFGTADELAPLLSEVSRALPALPARLSIESHAEPALPRRWQHAQANRWDAMWTDRAPGPVTGEDRVEVVSDDDEVNALLDRANPDTHGRPGDPGMRAWVGVREGAELVAVGALSTVVVTGIAHLRGVSTLPRLRGCGLGTAVSARLTRMGLDTVSPLVTLGVYTDNAAAISVYRRLGYHHDRSFVSGPLTP